MAMNEITMGSAITSELNKLTDAEKRNETLVWKAVSKAIIDHISNFAEIAPLNNVGITAGGGSGAPAFIATQGASEQKIGAIS